MAKQAIETVKKELEYVYVIQPVLSDDYRILHKEAVSLIQSAGGIYIGTSYQTIRQISPATFVGSGKLSEINETLRAREETVTVLFNGELSPSQTLHISELLDGRKVIDRTTLILDIFAKNALSGEGKVQVELAQLKYIYPRLKGEGAGLSRLGGGIGTRGPGETQLETDRRLIRERIRLLSGKTEEMKRRRALQTERRKKNGAKTIALVGYTNTGKSTLMNLLTESSVLVKNQLFATLDATARTMTIDDAEFILVDTVGFLQDLPHHLIDAFRSTLESAVDCDLALVVCDGAGEYERQLETTLETLRSLSFSSPYLVVVNQCDRLGADEISAFPKDYICISAKTGEGVPVLKERILEEFSDFYKFVTLFVPYEKTAKYNAVKKNIKERSVEYGDDGATVCAVIPSSCFGQFKEFIKNDP